MAVRNGVTVGVNEVQEKRDRLIVGEGKVVVMLTEGTSVKAKEADVDGIIVGVKVLMVEGANVVVIMLREVRNVREGVVVALNNPLGATKLEGVGLSQIAVVLSDGHVVELIELSPVGLHEAVADELTGQVLVLLSKLYEDEPDGLRDIVPVALIERLVAGLTVELGDSLIVVLHLKRLKDGVSLGAKVGVVVKLELSLEVRIGVAARVLLGKGVRLVVGVELVDGVGGE